MRQRKEVLMSILLQSQIFTLQALINISYIQSAFNPFKYRKYQYSQ